MGTYPGPYPNQNYPQNKPRTRYIYEEYAIRTLEARYRRTHSHSQKLRVGGHNRTTTSTLNADSTSTTKILPESKTIAESESGLVPKGSGAPSRRSARKTQAYRTTPRGRSKRGETPI